LKGILCGFNPKKVNDWIIAEDKPGYRYSSLFREYPLINYDVMPNPPISLKALEAFMGHSIKETSVPFDIDRPLTEAELAETVKYCRHDVEESVEVWVRNIAEFNTTMFFVNHFHLGSNSIGKTKAQLAAEILGGNGKGKTFDDEFDFPILDCLRLKKYRFVADWYKNPVNHNYGKAQENITVAGVPHTLLGAVGMGLFRNITPTVFSW
jgi:DNA polymerase